VNPGGFRPQGIRYPLNRTEFHPERIREESPLRRAGSFICESLLLFEGRGSMRALSVPHVVAGQCRPPCLGNASDNVAHACPDEGTVFRREAFLGFALGSVVPFNLKKHRNEAA
jgi:hypothetical protein